MTSFGELKCEVCGVPGSQTAMFRANPKGEKGRWRCELCLDVPPDEGVLAVTDWFQVDNMRKRDRQANAILADLTAETGEKT